MTRRSGLKQTLDALYDGRSQQHLAHDPLSFCHRYGDPRDREIAALIASCFAYGAVGVIKGSLEKIFSVMGSSPRRYVEQFEPRQGLKAFAGFKHRFNNGADLTALLWAMRHMLAEAGSIEAFFLRFHDPSAQTVEHGLTGFVNAVMALDYRPVFGAGGLPEKASYRFLFPSPASGSACKRLCMLLRWLVRPADGIDLGLWQGVRPDQLVIPVDRHIERIGQLLGLTSRRTPDWRMACEITDSLRRFDPADPVKYDFSLCHLGISGGCSGRNSPVCSTCGVSRHCAADKRIDRVKQF